MAYASKIITNPITGQTIKFLQTSRETNGALLEMESTYQAHSKEPLPHFHPSQNEHFKILQGSMHVRIGGQVMVLHTGETLDIPANQVHSMWNNSNEPTVVLWQVQPAMETEFFLEMGMGLAQDGKVNLDGTPNVLQGILLISRFKKVFRPAKPSGAVQELVFPLIALLARMMGYKATDNKYLD